MRGNRRFPSMKLMWRREGDSNPRNPCRFTRFPSVRTRPLCDLSNLRRRLPAEALAKVGFVSVIERPSGYGWQAIRCVYSTIKKWTGNAPCLLFSFAYFFLLQLPVQCIWPYFDQTTVFIANATMVNEAEEEPNPPPPEVKCSRNTA